MCSRFPDNQGDEKIKITQDMLKDVAQSIECLNDCLVVCASYNELGDCEKQACRTQLASAVDMGNDASDAARMVPKKDKDCLNSQ